MNGSVVNRLVIGQSRTDVVEAATRAIKQAGAVRVVLETFMAQSRDADETSPDAPSVTDALDSITRIFREYLAGQS